jgi:segregation and condensation protein A
MESKEIVEMMGSDQSWEQIIYKIIAWEGLDPWDLDITAISSNFVDYVLQMKEMDFKIPAKFVMIAAVLLRMKSDNLTLLKYFSEDNYVEYGDDIYVDDGEEADVVDNTEDGLLNFEVNAITVPQKRLPKRKIMVDELIGSLRKVLNSSERREIKKMKASDMIKVKEDNITKRIGVLYNKINNMLTRVRKDEVKFSKLVDKWEKQEVVNTFLPLIFLENEQKILCRQEDMFKEIFVKSRDHIDKPKKPKRKISKRVKNAQKTR